MELGQNVIKGLKIGAMLRLAAQIFTWLNTLILIRLLTPDDYGLMAMTMAFIGIFALMGDFGIAKAVIQTEDLDKSTLKQCFTVNIISCVCFFLIFFFSAPFIADFFNEPRVTLLIQIIAAQHLILIFHTLPYALASRNMLYKEREKVQFFTTLSTSVFTLALAATGWGVWSLILGHLFMRLVSTIGFFRLQPCWILPAWNFQGFSKIAAFSGLATINDVLRYLYNVFTNISIGKLLNKTDLGIFSVARNLANLPSDKIGELLNHLGLSSFAKLQNEKDVAGLYLIKSLQLASLALFPVYFGMCAVAPELITLVLSETWVAAIVPFQILCLSSPLRMLSEILATASTAVGEPKKNTWALLGSLTLLPTILFGIQYGVTGACLAWLGVTGVSFIFHLWSMLPVFQVSAKDFFKALAPGFISSALMLTGLMLIRYQAFDINSWLLFGAMILAGGLIFILSMLLLFRMQTKTILGYLRH
ncbi:MAG: lipopolysaccharide biosynthesis protein [Endozoicomonas sp.]|uniref:lipopolysaccharide biosynthesis protein n=1 Tax=Endozoicomonas sp. TaxID=1892382 RepID=UPI003D9BBA48